MNYSLQFVAALSASAVLSNAYPGLAQSIVTISYSGTGCPQGSVGQSISNDRTVATLIFDSFFASTGPGVPVTEAQKNCQITVNLDGPGKDNVTSTIRGYVQLPSALDTATLRQTYSRGDHQRSRSVGFQAVTQDYLDTLFVKQNGGNRVPSFVINLEANVTSQNSALTTIDSLDLKLSP